MMGFHSGKDQGVVGSFGLEHTYRRGRLVKVEGRHLSSSPLPGLPLSGTDVWVTSV